MVQNETSVKKKSYRLPMQFNTFINIISKQYKQFEMLVN